MTEQQKQKRRAWWVRYRQTAKGPAVTKTAAARYRQTAKGRAAHRAEQARYHQTVKGRAVQKAGQARYRLTVKSKASRLRWRVAHPERYAAHRAVTEAVRRGTLVRASRCASCDKRRKTMAHHYRGYALRQQLEVEWLCAPCHAEEH